MEGKGRWLARGWEHHPSCDVDMDLQKHIEQCSCACNHMGYGNYMDYQMTTCLSELPDVAPPIDLLPVMHSVGVGTTPLHKADSTSSSSSKAASSAADNKGDSGSGGGGRRRGGLLCRPWCLGLLACVLGSALGAGLGLPLALGFRLTWPFGGHNHLDVVRRLLAEVPLIDGHNELAWNVRRLSGGRLGALNLSADLRQVEPWASSPWSHTDLNRLRTGLVGAQFWSVYVPCAARHLDAVQLAVEQVDLLRRMADMYPKHLQLVTSAKGVLKAHLAGRVASLVSVQGGHALGNSLAVLRALYSLGARSLTLTGLCSTA